MKTSFATERKMLKKQHDEEKNRVKRIADLKLIHEEQERQQMKKAILRGIKKALNNIRKILKADPDFRKFFIDVINGGYPYSDNSGFCGFPPPPEKWEVVPKNDLPTMLNNLKAKRLVGSLEDYVSHVKIIRLYKENENVDTHSKCGALLALTARMPSFIGNTTERNLDFTIVMMTENVLTRPFGQREFFDINTQSGQSYPRDKGFLSVLNKLSEPKSTYKFFIQKFDSLEQ